MLPIMKQESNVKGKTVITLRKGPKVHSKSQLLFCYKVFNKDVRTISSIYIFQLTLTE